ncbi:MAG: glycosyltransferase family 4 protein [Candidatus Altiarchaeota archaeon]
MRILIVSYDYAPKVGGHVNNAVLLAREFGRLHDVSVVTDSSLPASKGVHPLMSPTPSLPFHTGSLIGLVNARRVVENLGRDFDAVLSVDCNASMFTAAWYSILTRVPYACMLNGLDFYSWANPRSINPGKMLLKRLVARASLLIANSRYTRDTALRCGLAGRMEVVNPPVDVDRFKALPDVSSERSRLSGSVLLSVGRLVGRKGFRQVLEALSTIDREYTYYIVGDGPERDSLMEHASALGISGRVVFAGQVSDNGLLKYYPLCDFLILTPCELPDSGDYEGFGIVYVEANACGRPVVASRTGGIPDAVSDGVSGILLRENSVEGIREAILEMMGGRDFPEQGLLEWADRFKPDVVAGQHLKLLESII